MRPKISGSPFALKSGDHVRVTALLENVPNNVSKWMDSICTVVGLVFGCFLSYALIGATMASFDRGTVSFTINRVPLVYPQAIMAFGGTVLTMQFLARLLRIVFRIDTEKEPDGDQNYLREKNNTGKK